MHCVQWSQSPTLTKSKQTIFAVCLENCGRFVEIGQICNILLWLKYIALIESFDLYNEGDSFTIDLGRKPGIKLTWSLYSEKIISHQFIFPH